MRESWRRRIFGIPTSSATATRRRSDRYVGWKQRASCSGIARCPRRSSMRKRTRRWRHRSPPISADGRRSPRKDGVRMRTIVTKEMLREAAREVRRLGPHPAKVKLSKVEPELVAHVLKGLDGISKKLAHL